MIDIQLDEHVAQVGQQVRGNAMWTPDATVNPREIRVSLEWRTEGRGTASTGKCGEARFPPGPQGFLPPVHMPFEFTLPVDGPVSYDGKLIRILWELVVRIDLPWASDEVGRAPLQVVPRKP